ncbi:hypothetical protein [Amorphus sp. MBR-141]
MLTLDRRTMLAGMITATAAAPLTTSGARQTVRAVDTAPRRGRSAHV